MTDTEWNVSTDPQAMLCFLRHSERLTERGLRLFWCACCRRIWPLIPPGYQGIVVASERYANGQCGQSELREAENQAYREHGSQGLDAARWAATCVGGEWILDQLYDPEETSHYHAALAVKQPDLERAAQTAIVRDMFRRNLAVEQAMAWEVNADREPAGILCFESVLFGPRGRIFEAWQNERQSQCELLRDIFANPFRSPPTISPSLLTPTVSSVATAAYNERNLPAGTLDNAKLAALAAALEQAGCEDAGLLGYLRSEGTHVRGCFAVDAVLGRA